MQKCSLIHFAALQLRSGRGNLLSAALVLEVTLKPAGTGTVHDGLGVSGPELVLGSWWSKGMDATKQEGLSWKPQLLQAPWNCSFPHWAGTEPWSRPSLPGCEVVSAYAAGWHDELLINGRRRQLLRKCLINPYWSKRGCMKPLNLTQL